MFSFAGSSSLGDRQKMQGVAAQIGGEKSTGREHFLIDRSIMAGVCDKMTISGVDVIAIEGGDIGEWIMARTSLSGLLMDLGGHFIRKPTPPFAFERFEEQTGAHETFVLVFQKMQESPPAGFGRQDSANADLNPFIIRQR